MPPMPNERVNDDGQHEEVKLIVSVPTEFEEGKLLVNTTSAEPTTPTKAIEDSIDPVQVEVVITDLDETFWMPGECCPSENVETARLLKQAGVPLILATGRTLKAAKRGLLRFGIEKDLSLFPGIYSDGGLIYGENENDVIRDNRLTPEQIRLAKEYATELDPITLCGFSFDEGQGFTSRAAFAELTGSRNLARWDEDVLELPANLTPEFWDEHGCYFLVVHSNVLSETGAAQDEYVKRVRAIGCEAVVFKNYDFLLVKPSGVDKASALKTLIQHYGWEEKKCLFIGDGANDISAMKALPVTVCMRNGISRALEAAKYITNQRIEDGGWAETVFRVTERARQAANGTNN